jgi:hypothetical protein
MKTNMGGVDRVIRLILGLAIAVLGYVFQSWWGLLSLIFFITAAISICPLYIPFGLSTKPKAAAAESPAPEPPAEES